jgi:hypothetical protein
MSGPVKHHTSFCNLRADHWGDCGIQHPPPSPDCPECAKYRRDYHRERVRRLGGRQVEGYSHCTSCSIWADDGQGGETEDGFKPPFPCNCGALINWYKKQAEDAGRARDEMQEHCAKAADPAPVCLNGCSHARCQVHREIAAVIRGLEEDDA